MRRRLSKIGWIVSGLVVLGAISLWLTVRMIDTHQLKQTIETMIADHTHLSAKIAGAVEIELGWAPTLVARDIQIRHQDTQAVLGSIKSAQLTVGWWSLLSRSAHLKKLVVKGLMARYTDVSFWSLSKPSGQIPLPDSQRVITVDLDSLPTVEIQESLIDVSAIPSAQRPDWLVDYQWLAVKHLQLSAIEATSLSANVKAEGQLLSNATTDTLTFELSSKAQYERGVYRFVMTDLDSQFHLPAIAALHDVSVSADRLHWQLREQIWQAQNLRFDNGRVSGLADIQAQMGDGFRWQSTLQINPLNAAAFQPFFDGYDVKLPALTVGATELTISGNEQRIQVRNLRSALEGNALAGNLTYNRKLPTFKIDLQLAQFALDGILAENGISLYSKELLPDWLWQLPVSGSLRIDNFKANMHEMSRLNCALVHDIRQLHRIRCQWQHPRYNLFGDVLFERGDAMPIEPSMKVWIKVDRLPISEWLSQQQSSLSAMIDGSIAGKLFLNTQGKRPIDWLEKLSGTADFDLDQTVIQHANLNHWVAEALVNHPIEQMGTVMGNLEAYLPNTAHNVLSFTDTKLQARFENGQAIVDEIFFVTQQRDEVMANIVVELLDMNLTINALARLGHLSAHPWLADFSWPIHCEGSLRTRSMNQICKAGVGDLATIVAKAIQIKNREQAESEARAAINALSKPNASSVLPQNGVASDSSAEQSLQAELQQSLLNSVFGQQED